MQNTRLNTLFDTIVQNTVGWLQNPWRRISLLIISILGGNFFATVAATTAGQNANLDVLVSFLLVLLAELISWLVYGSRRRLAANGEPSPARSLLFENLNGLKIGVIYGLFVEAFKLGS
jgi:hypothetical protein